MKPFGSNILSVIYSNELSYSVNALYYSVDCMYVQDARHSDRT